MNSMISYGALKKIYKNSSGRLELLASDIWMFTSDGDSEIYLCRNVLYICVNGYVK